MKSLGNFKRGDTFAFYANLTDKSTGEKITYDVSAFKAQVRNPQGKLYGTLTVAKNELVVGQYLFSTTSEVTSTWPATIDGVELHIDIEITVNEVKTSSETFSVIVKQDVTQAV